MTLYSIGQIGKQLNLSVDTLRYYEKLGLLPNVNRTPSGTRRYSEKEITRLQFIRRAQKMNFSLHEIKELLDMRNNPTEVCGDVQLITQHKLDEIESHIEELSHLRDELRGLLSQCTQGNEGCPIIEGIEYIATTKPPHEVAR